MPVNINDFILSWTMIENSGLGEIVTDGLVLNLDSGYKHSYPMAGTTWYDLSGNSNNGTLVNDPIFSTNNGGTITFNGTDNYSEIVHSSLLAPSTGVITTEVWFKATAVGSENGSILLNKENEYEISAGGGFISYAFRPNWAWVGSTGFSINQWYCVAVTYDQSFQRMYINGLQVYSAALTGAIGNVYSNALRIGARGAPSSAFGFFEGQIPVVRVYNRALTASEILQNYNTTKIRFSEVLEVPSQEDNFDILVVGGGGGGGDRHGGGGGAGGYIANSVAPLIGSSYTVTVGAGGAGGSYEAFNSSPRGSGVRGSDSSISTIATAYGGGGGGTYDGNPTGTFGSGGGGGGRNLSGISGTSGQGNSGGSGALPGGGGGGGAGAAGGNANNGSGGVGLQWVDGNYYAGGGGGAWGSSSGPTTPGGIGGGGAGDWNDANIESGAPNTGGGGGASRSEQTSTAGRPGGSGIVAIKYPSSYTISVGAGLTSNTVTSGNFKITTFTVGTGTVTFS